MPLSQPAQPAGFHPFKRTIVDIVRTYDASRPRSLQKHLGPSEIGAPCARQIAYKLAGLPEVNEVADPWFPIIGTSVHAFLATAVEWYNDEVLGRKANPRFLVENRVKVDAALKGHYATSGSTDVYDVDEKRVVDWKIVGTTTMRKVQKSGSPEQYKVQANTYGRGWEQAGYEVRELLIAYLPRSNFLDKMYLDCLPYEPQLAIEAQARVGGIQAMLHAGVRPEQFPAAGCTIWCPFLRPKVELGGTSCPGHGEVADE